MRQSRYVERPISGTEKEESNVAKTKARMEEGNAPFVASDVFNLLYLMNRFPALRKEVRELIVRHMKEHEAKRKIDGAAV
jgi:hypothetical protein